MGPAAEAPIDYQTLAERLTALGSPTRLELLSLLRLPRKLTEVILRPRRVQPGENPERASSRQTINLHLDKLEEAGFIRKELIEHEGRRLNLYHANTQRLYEVVEELRRVQMLYAGADSEATTTLGTGLPPAARATGPRLVLVHGLYDGKIFLLDKGLADERGWLVGRKRDLAISLDYDPFVSLENSLVTHRRGQFQIQDIEGSKNGTIVNWELLAPGATHELRTGDIIHVGRSRLLFLQA